MNWNKKFIIEAVGWYGTVAIIAAYFLNSFSILPAANFWYQFLNVTGAVGIVLISYSKKAYQPLALNVIWTFIGLAAIARLLLRA